MQNDTCNGLAALLRQALGARWQALHPDIRARFTPAPGTTMQAFNGSMQVVERSTLGWLIAKLIAFVRILPAIKARDVPFEFHLASAQDSGWIKQRIYHFQSGRFEFKSVMKLDAAGDLIEQFAYGLGMKIRLVAEADKLYFLDDGYFLRSGTLRLPLPRWLTVGRFELIHQNTDRDNFTVEINLEHPLLGRLFHQHGHFRQAPVSAVNAYGAAAPDQAHRAQPETAYC